MYCRRLFKIIPTKRWVSNNYWKYWDYGCMGLTRSLQPICRRPVKSSPMTSDPGPNDFWPPTSVFWPVATELLSLAVGPLNSWLLTSGFWALVAGRWALDFLAPGLWLRIYCHWPWTFDFPVPGHWLQISCHWPLNNWRPGIWPLVLGLWLLTSSPRPLASDLFSLDSGF